MPKSDNKVTKKIFSYPKGEEPTLIIPEEYRPYRFVLGQPRKKTLIAICMNPSAARKDYCDRTINRVIIASQKLGYDGWLAVNTYPERATDALNLDKFDPELNSTNVAEIKKILKKYNVNEVWGAWGDLKHNSLIKGRDAILEMLAQEKIKIFHFGNLTKSGNPHHPLYFRIEGKEKRYLSVNYSN